MQCISAKSKIISNNEKLDYLEFDTGEKQLVRNIKENGLWAWYPVNDMLNYVIHTPFGPCQIQQPPDLKWDYEAEWNGALGVWDVLKQTDNYKKFNQINFTE